MKIAICDDNANCIREIQTFLNDVTSFSFECNEYQSGENLLESFKDGTTKFDIIFLDMEMKGLDGIETGKMIREFDEDVLIIFVTYHEKYMKESFTCRPFRFITKPINCQEFCNAINDAKDYIDKYKRCLSFNDNKDIINIPLSEVVYCECEAHWIWIHTEYEKYKMFSSMKDLSQMLGSEMFGRTHKSYIVNYNYVRSIVKNDMNLRGFNITVPISRTYKKKAKSDYEKYMERKSGK